MYSAISILILFYAFWLYKKSRNDFFMQSREILLEKRGHLIDVLNNFQIKDINRWLEAYDNLKNYPTVFQYDGATIVKDLHTIYGYDAPAGNHDFGYVMIQDLPYFKWLKASFLLDLQYAKDMRSLQIPWLTAWSRFIGLLLLKPIYPLSRINFKTK